ncbi:ABC transporter, ATP binding protein [Aeropyrum pernix]|uniref:ABC transporter, ATP binding protein n=1 Tax=Aeropyrum pernix TaxID=56636 RepID=A0A401H7J7_AERPX|nr:ABC transporter, ATP binding protein [Aeropyrum pernix]
MASVKLESVWKVFGNVVAVRDVNLYIEDKEFVSILGPSGSGKTTLLYLIAGIYKPSRGRIYFNDVDVTDLPPNKRNIGLVFQNYALYPHMTVYENIAFPLRLRNFGEPAIKEKVLGVAKLLGIEGLLERYPSQLSGGQQQRVALARALVKEPEVLLLDEPLSNLDALLRIKIRSELKKLQKELGITAIYVTHDQSEALAMADRIAIIASGVIQQVGKPWDVYYKPRNVFVASFIGTPPANLVSVPLDSSRRCLLLPGGGRYCPPRRIAEKLAAVKANSVILGFRPEVAVLSESPLGDYVSMEAEVYTVETLGRENIVTLLVNGSQVKVIVPPVVEPRPGSRIFINIEEDKVMYFDPETEINVEYLEVPGMEEAIAESAGTLRKQEMEEEWD